MGNSFIFVRKLILRRGSLLAAVLYLLFSVLCPLPALRSFSVGGSSAFAESRPLKIHFIDVGEGDSILIEAPNGEAALIDAGNLITGFRVAEYLKENDIQNLECLIFTHHDLDHIGGAFFVLQMIDVEKIYDNGDDLTEVAKSSDIYRWYEELVREDENYRVLKMEDIFSLGEIILKVLWPPQPLPFSNFNAISLVIMVEYGEFRSLLTGDLTIPGERELLKRRSDLKADVLKVGHHGNSDASSIEFLKAVSPKISIISVNKDNIRGYPSQEVLKRLKELGSKVFRTDRDGDIIVSVGEDGKITVQAHSIESGYRQ